LGDCDMETSQKKNGMHWLLMAFVIAAVIVLLAKVLNNPSAEGPEEAVMPAGDARQEEPGPTPSEAKPAEATKVPETVIQPALVPDPQRGPTKEPTFSSGKPLYFRVVFGQESTDSTLGVLDELGGTGTGYNVAYVDENRNGDLTDDAAKTFAKYERGSRAGQTNPTFTFSGPSENKASAKYTLNLYALARNAPASAGDHYFFWTLDTDTWNYFFINGRIRLSSSVADAMTGPPIRLGGQCKWQISSGSKDGKAMVSAGLKDENGCTLRLVRLSGKILSPRLSLLQDGKVKAEKDMEFG
jgi:hypothetical protein